MKSVDVEKTNFNIHLHTNIFVDNIKKGENFLILHADDYKPNPHLSLALIKNSLNKNEEVFFITNENNKIDIRSLSGRNGGGGGVIKADFNDRNLENKILNFTDSLKSKNQFGRIILESSGDDFEKAVKLTDFVSGKVSEYAHKKWSRKGYKIREEKFKNFLDFFVTIPLSCMDTDKMRSITGRFSRSIVLSGDTIFFYNENYDSKIISNGVKVDFIKNNLTHIILLILLSKPVCGYDIMKTIFEKFKVSLPQSTVYTTLYMLKKRGVTSEKISGDKKTKVFYLNNPEEVKSELLLFIDFIGFFESNFDLDSERLSLRGFGNKTF